MDEKVNTWNYAFECFGVPVLKSVTSQEIERLFATFHR